MKWEEVPFQSLYAEPSRNGVYKPKEFHGSGCKIVNMGELFAYNFINHQEMNRLELTEAELERAHLQKGDLLFGRRSLVEAGAGKCSLVTNLDEPTTFESSIIRVRLTNENILPEFYYYWFLSPLGRGRIKAIVSGTNVKGIRGSDLERILVVKPPHREQEKIVSILSTYDESIENNSRRIHLLEAVARLLYGEWFIRLRFPGHERVRLIDGVPEGWERKPLETVTTYINRGITPRYDDGGESLIINQKCIRDGNLDLSLARRQNKEFKEEKQVAQGDVLLNSTGEGTLGRIAQVWIDIPNCTVDSHVSIVRPIEEYEKLWFGFTMLLLEPLFAGMGEGATNQTELKRQKIAAVQILVPPKELRTRYDTHVQDIVQQVNNLKAQNERLRQARDILLPRLMNGELEV